MKTIRELLDFYDIEIGKKYKVISRFGNKKDHYVGSIFTIKNVNNMVIFLDFNNHALSIENLNEFEYEEVKSERLDKKEKKYLTNIIKPFRDRVDGIYKKETIHQVGIEYKEFICIEIEDDASICLPNFDKGSMYKGMEIEKKYTLKELGL